MRSSALVCLGCLVATPAFADRGYRPQLFELGINTRHFAASEQDVAFRGSGEMDPSLGAGSAVSTSVRFTGAAFRTGYVGVEGEAGALVGLATSNLAGAYGVGGARGNLGPVRLSAELVAGRRWVRYSLAGQRSDPAAWIAEPRVRGDLWLGSQVTLGGAIGATLGDRSVWMAGIYIGLHSHPFDRFGAGD